MSLFHTSPSHDDAAYPDAAPYEPRFAATESLSPTPPPPLPWLWPARIPLSAITLLVGDPGVGKSLLLADLAARVSAGLPLPGLPPRFCNTAASTRPTEPVSAAAGALPPGIPTGCILLCPEDSTRYVLGPRLTAAGANPVFLNLVTGVSETLHGAATPLILPDHLRMLAQAIRGVDCPRLLIIDPLPAVVSPHPTALTATLAGLGELAARYSVAIVVTTHLVKNHALRPLYRARGSLSLVAAARSVLWLAHDPDDADRRLLLSLKSVYGPVAPTLAFRIAPAPPTAPQTPDLIPQSLSPSIPIPDLIPRSPSPSIPVLTWDAAPSHRLPPDLLSLGADAHSALNEACAWLRTELASGPQPARELLTAARAAGLSLVTLRRAKRILAIRSIHVSGTTWHWSLPPRTSHVPASANQGGDQLDVCET